ncbi:glycerophosphodiester phosphodiesterase [Blastococcus sp. Marseille-P5729]|uniref:glycerophosphodiester phosphodiesterase n=1 Tax=Blastococcus sp. Marseille-P5729 TaxID=2086582 RepID=UPI000D0E83DA|nr:glycerophosphodiester phosphodiesterase [Blastococcus sp. Marseille-P5729]
MSHPLLRAAGSPPLVIAHRGASADAPENTMPAFELGWRSARWLETDVQPTADGVPVLLHDDDLDRTTDLTGPVRLAPYEQVRAADAGSWLDPRFSGTPVPTLQALLGALPGDGRVLLEIKGPHTDRQLAAVLEVVEASDADDRVLLQSFERDELARLHRMRPDRPLGLLTVDWDEDPVATCAAYGAIAYNPDFRLWHGRQAELERLHAHGVSSTPWTVDEPADWRWLSDMGIDGIITNRPAALARWLS